jgi:hypothetical protein
LRIRDDVEHVFVQHAHAAGGDCAHRELFMPGHSQFADDKNIEWNFKPMRHFKSDRHSATRERQHNDVVPPAMFQQLFCELPTSVGTVLKSE